MPHLSSVLRFDPFLILSGQLGFDSGGNLPVGIDAQTRQCLNNIAATLAEEGAELGDVLKTTVFITCASDYAAFDAAYADMFGGHRPARSTVVTGLAVEGALVEIEVLARAVDRPAP